MVGRMGIGCSDACDIDGSFFIRYLLYVSADQYHAVISTQSRIQNATTWSVARRACHLAKRSSFALRSASSSGVPLRLSMRGAALVVAKECSRLSRVARDNGSISSALVC